MDREAQAHDTIDLLASELDDVEWFGRETLDSAPARVGALDQLLFLMGANLVADTLH